MAPSGCWLAHAAPYLKPTPAHTRYPESHKETILTYVFEREYDHSFSAHIVVWFLVTLCVRQSLMLQTPPPRKHDRDHNTTRAVFDVIHSKKHHRHPHHRHPNTLTAWNCTTAPTMHVEFSASNMHKMMKRLRNPWLSRAAPPKNKDI